MYEKVDFFNHSRVMVKAEVAEENDYKMWAMPDEKSDDVSRTSKRHCICT